MILVAGSTEHTSISSTHRNDTK